MRQRSALSVDELALRRTARRIGVQTAAGFAVLVIALAAVGGLVVLHSQHQADDQLIAMAIARADDVTDPPAGVWLVIRHGERQASSPGLPAGLPDEAQLVQVAADGIARTTDVTAHDREYRVETRPRADGSIQALLDLSADHAERYRLLEAFLISGVAGLLLAAAVGVWLARRAVAPMAEALALQRRFVADASHELRTPLTLLSTRAQLIHRELRQDDAIETIRADVDGLVTDAHQLTDILDDMLLAADPRETATDELVRLPLVVAEAVESARPLAQECGVRLTIGPSAADLPPVAGGRAALRRAVTALLDNAIRHAAGEVRVATFAAAGHVVVDVADDGQGVASEMESTLFHRFATVRGEDDPGARRRYGLGLALVSDIAARHGGSVSVVDDGHPGATMRIRLPARPRHRGNSQDDPAPSSV